MLRIETVQGPNVQPYLPELARLRIAVFRDWPYRYDGNWEYEQQYLETYARSPRSLFVLGFDGDTLVGASTGVPLSDEVELFRAPFVAAGFEPGDVFYFGESVLLPPYRGKGLGHRYFDAREQYARALGRFRWTAFCAVIRQEDDPRRPADARPLDPFWRARGYRPEPGLEVELGWRELGDAEPSMHRLQCWLRALDA